MRRRNKYSRRTSISLRKKRIITTIILVVVSVAVLFGIAVGVGAYLKRKAESYEPKKEYELEDNAPPASDGAVAVQAPMFTYGEYVYGYVQKGYSDLSLSLGTAESVTFKSEVAQSVSGVESGEIKLEEYSSIIHKYEGRACAYFKSSAFECEDENLRRVKKAYEISLLCEAAASGIDDILILGINVTQANCDEVARYLSELNSAVGDCSVGIAINAGTLLLTDNEVYLAGKLKSACDFVALDLRRLDFSGDQDTDDGMATNLAEYLNQFKYYLSAYSVRLVFSDANSKFFDEAIKLGLSNVQVADDFIS